MATIRKSLTAPQLAELKTRLPDIKFTYIDNVLHVDAADEAITLDVLCEILPVVQPLEYHIPPVRKPVRHHRTVRNAGADWVLSL